MSIATVEEISRPAMAVWLIWLAAALVLALYAGRDRWWELWTTRREDHVISMRLFACAGGTFLAWLGMQYLCSSFVRELPDAIEGDRLSPPALAAMSVVCPVGAMIVGLILVRHRHLRDAVGLWSHKLPVSLLWGMLGAVVAIPVVFFSLQATLTVLESMGIQHADKHRLLEVFAHADRRWVKYAVISAAVVVSPVFEELLFRGLIQTSFTRLTGHAWAGILVASVLFAGVHEQWTQPPIFVLSIVIGVVYTFSASLWSAILLHALFNTFSLVLSGMS